MSRSQVTRRKTRKGSKKLTDDIRAAQIAIGFQASYLAKVAAAHAMMSDEEKEAEIVSIRKQLGILPRKKPGMKPPDVDEGPYEIDTTEETDTTEQASAHAPEDTIDINNNNDNNDKDEEEDSTLHP